MPTINHYTVIFNNHSSLYGLDDAKWYYYDDIGESDLKEILNEKVCLSNLRVKYGLALFIYKRIIFN